MVHYDRLKIYKGHEDDQEVDGELDHQETEYGTRQSNYGPVRLREENDPFSSSDSNDDSMGPVLDNLDYALLADYPIIPSVQQIPSVSNVEDTTH